jgi:hypothetical protein
MYEEKRKREVVRDPTFGAGGKKLISGFEGSQAVPVHPSGGGNADDRI